eukprot:TRINITY_DN67724_c0_g1_i1.p1 TRINITY_DN67724_c0_g1~~TRINITY_DN67724_c0_g1_i1.p1  ORF type:complete len:708 (+),score=166.65 TRINITY_DN67724_c0_g1_i1:132-2255(+)
MADGTKMSAAEAFLSAAGFSGNDHIPTLAEVHQRRMVLFAMTTTAALTVEVAYAKAVPKIPQLYAVLLRAAVWDCVLVGVVVAQLTDLSSLPMLAGTDGGHYLPVAVCIYHAITLIVCLAYDIYNRNGGSHVRQWHRALVGRRVLLELAGGNTGSKLVLGRLCFLVSGGAMWLALRVLMWVEDPGVVLAGFIIIIHAAYCAAGFAALEPKRTTPGRLVQWLCTGWGTREAFLHGPLKIIGAIFLLPFSVSVVAAQIWLRMVAFLVWLGFACPCCRLQQQDNVYDAFEREMVIPLLQCSFLAFACTLAALVLGFAQIDSDTHRLVVGTFTVYYTFMLLVWTAPAVLQAKVGSEEAFQSASLFGEDGQPPLLDEEGSIVAASEADSESTHYRELDEIPKALPGDARFEEMQAKCEEMRALLHRDRRHYSLEVAQLQSKLQDSELQLRKANQSLEDAKCEIAAAAKKAAHFQAEATKWRDRCAEAETSAATMTADVGRHIAAKTSELPKGKIQDREADGGRQSTTAATNAEASTAATPSTGGGVDIAADAIGDAAGTCEDVPLPVAVAVAPPPPPPPAIDVSLNELSDGDACREGTEGSTPKRESFCGSRNGPEENAAKEEEKGGEEEKEEEHEEAAGGEDVADESLEEEAPVPKEASREEKDEPNTDTDQAEETTAMIAGAGSPSPCSVRDDDTDTDSGDDGRRLLQAA